MRKTILAAALLLAGCSSQPVDRAQLQQDLATAVAALQAAGCATSVLASAAAPIVAVTADDQGNKTLALVGAAGATVCRVAAPSAVTAAIGTTLGAVVAAP